MGITRTSANRFDWISVVEARYSLRGSDSQWLRRILDQVSPLLGRGTNPLSWTFCCTSTTFTLDSSSEGASKALTYVARMSHALAAEKSLNLPHRPGDHRYNEQVRASSTPEGCVRSLLVINCQSGMGSSVSIASCSRKVRTQLVRKGDVTSNCSAYWSGGTYVEPLVVADG